MIVVMLITILALLAVPNFVRARRRTQDSMCINNMKVIASGVEQVAFEENLNLISAGFISWNMPPASGTFGIVGVASYVKAVPVCPNAGTYAAWGGPVGDVRLTCTGPQHDHQFIYNGGGGTYFAMQ